MAYNGASACGALRMRAAALSLRVAALLYRRPRCYGGNAFRHAHHAAACAAYSAHFSARICAW
jgi:hypothetical protein